MVRYHYVLIAIVSGLVGGCDRPLVAVDEPIAARSAIARDSGALFQTDSLTSSLHVSVRGYDATIGISLINKTAGPIYIVNCGGATSLRLERRVGDQWVAC